MLTLVQIESPACCVSCILASVHVALVDPLEQALVV